MLKSVEEFKVFLFVFLDQLTFWVILPPSLSYYWKEKAKLKNRH